jgi:hypothetical protein
MVLRVATSLLGALEGVGPENLDSSFLGPYGTRETMPEEEKKLLKF